MRKSFVPPREIRALRNLTRYRKAQIRERASRSQQAAQDSRGHRHQARDCVASDILGASGRAMLDAIVSGTTDPEVLADLAKTRQMRMKIPELREALEGRFDTVSITR